MTDEKVVHLHLQKQSRRLTVVCSLTLLFGVLLLRLTALNPDFSARRWLMISALVVAGEFWFLRRVLDQNHPPGQKELYPDLGSANRLTIFRGIAYAWMAGFLLMPRPGGLMDWLPALLYGGASIADVFDGYLARRSGRVSRLGVTLDMEFDGLGVLVGCALAVQYGQLPLLFLLVAAARPLFVWGMLWRTRMGLPNYPMTASDQRRIIAGLLMTFLSTLLWPIFEPPVTHAVGAVFGGAVAPQLCARLAGNYRLAAPWPSLLRPVARPPQNVGFFLDSRWSSDNNCSAGFAHGLGRPDGRIFDAGGGELARRCGGRSGRTGGPLWRRCKGVGRACNCERFCVLLFRRPDVAGSVPARPVIPLDRPR